jgi:phosphatidylinositol transfer protein SFH5
MELALSSLDIAAATTPITSNDIEDPYKITQVHDYKSISFLRQSSTVKAASTETIKVFTQNYPELLKEKYFLNVPALMSFIYGLIRHFVAPKTARKFHPMADGRALAAEYTGTSKTKVPGLGKMLPKEFGGEGAGLAEAGKAPMYE